MFLLVNCIWFFNTVVTSNMWLNFFHVVCIDKDNINNVKLFNYLYMASFVCLFLFLFYTGEILLLFLFEPMLLLVPSFTIYTLHIIWNEIFKKRYLFVGFRSLQYVCTYRTLVHILLLNLIQNFFQNIGFSNV